MHGTKTFLNFTKRTANGWHWVLRPLLIALCTVLSGNRNRPRWAVRYSAIVLAASGWLLGALTCRCANALTDRATEGVSAVTAKEAVERRLCFEVYWWDRHYQQGVPLPVKIIVDGAEFQVRVDDIEVDRGGKRWFGRYDGTIHNGRAMVRTSSNFPMVPGAAEAPSDFGSKSPGGEVFDDTLTIPLNCVPRGTLSSEKTRIIETAVGTMQEMISRRSSEAETRASGVITVTIGDFDVDYPSLYVLVKPLGKVYEVTIHDPEAQDDAAYQGSGHYLFRELTNAAEARRVEKKILRHGVTSTVIPKNITTQRPNAGATSGLDIPLPPE